MGFVFSRQAEIYDYKRIIEYFKCYWKYRVTCIFLRVFSRVLQTIGDYNRLRKYHFGVSDQGGSNRL